MGLRAGSSPALLALRGRAPRDLRRVGLRAVGWAGLIGERDPYRGEGSVDAKV